MDQSHVVRIPVHLYEVMNKINRLSDEYNFYMGRDPLKKELVDDLGISEITIVNALNAMSKFYMIDSKYSSDYSDSLIDVADNSPNPEELLVNKLFNEDIKVLINFLNDKQKNLLNLRYGFYNKEEHTLEEIGNLYHLTRERIRQLQVKIEIKILEKIKKFKLVL